MNSFNILEKVRTDFKNILQKLSTYRKSNDFKNYKTLCDAGETLIRMNFRNSDKKLIGDGANKPLYKKWDDDSIIFFTESLFAIEKEMEELSKSMESAFDKPDARDYRTLLVSFEKLNSIQEYIKGHINRI